MKEFFPALAIGALLGFASLFLRELGWMLAIAAMGLLGLYYARQRRTRAFAWFLLGGAGVWILLLAPVAIGGMTDPQGSATVPQTYLALLVAVILSGSAVIVLLSETHAQH